MKKILLAWFSRNLVSFVNLLIRRDYTTKHRGVDPILDESIRFVCLKELFGLDQESMRLEHYSQELVDEILLKVSPLTHSTIENLRTKYGRLLDAIVLLNGDVKAKVRQVGVLSIFIGLLSVTRNKYRQYRYFRDLHRVRISISAESVGLLLSILVPLLFIGALLRQYMLSSAFGFPMELVYGTDDYISSSVSSLIYAVFPIALSALFLAVVIIGDRGHDSISVKINAKKAGRDLVFFNIVFTVGMIAAYFFRNDQFFQFLPLYFFFVLNLPLATFLAKNFTHGRVLFIAILLISQFFFGVYNTTRTEISSIKDGTREQQLRVTSDVANLNLPTTYLVASGNRGVVFWDSDTKKTTIVKAEDIKFIEIH